MTWAIYAGGTPLDSLGVWVEDVGGRFSGVARSYPVLTLPGRQGGLLAADPETGPRILTISGTIDPAARSLTARSDAEDRLKSLASRGLVTVVTDDDETTPRLIEGVCESLTITPVVHPMVTQLSRFQLTLRCPDPTWRDLTQTAVALSTDPTPVPMGTAPTGGLIRIVAPAWSANVVDPSVGYQGADGDIGGSVTGGIALTGTLTAGTDYLEIDLDRQTIVKVSSGTITNAISWLSTGEFWGMDINDGDVFAGAYPSLRLSAGSGTPVGSWTGFRRWL